MYIPFCLSRLHVCVCGECFHFFLSACVFFSLHGNWQSLNPISSTLALVGNGLRAPAPASAPVSVPALASRVLNLADQKLHKLKINISQRNQSKYLKFSVKMCAIKVDSSREGIQQSVILNTMKYIQ